MFGRQPTGDLILDYRLKYASSYLRVRAQSHRVHHPRLLERLSEKLYSGLETQGPCPAAPHSPEDRQQVNGGGGGPPSSLNTRTFPTSRPQSCTCQRIRRDSSDVFRPATPNKEIKRRVCTSLPSGTKTRDKTSRLRSCVRTSCACLLGRQRQSLSSTPQLQQTAEALRPEP